MRKTLAGLVFGTALLVVAMPCEAQRPFGGGISAGVSIPISDLSKSHETGYNAAAHVRINLPILPLTLRLEGFYNKLGARVEDIVGDPGFRIAGGNLDLIYTFGGMPIRPYVIGGAGFYNVKYIRGSSTDVGFNAGLGAKFRLARVGTFAEARLHMIRDERRFQFVPMTFGFEL